MASLSHIITFLSLFTIFISLTNAQSTKPRALFLPITKDASTLQYITQLHIGTPPAKKSLVLDLGGRSFWINCETNYASSSYKPAYCGSAACSVAKAHCTGVCFTTPRPGCNNNTCQLLTQNPFWGGQISQAGIDTISIQSTDGAKAGRRVNILSFVFACGDRHSLLNVANGVSGMLGFSKERIALPPQLYSSLGGSFRHKFAICLPSSSNPNGIVLLGDFPYTFYPHDNRSVSIDVSPLFLQTNLYVNYEKTASPRVQGVQMPEYFIKITSILVNKIPIKINSTLLEFHRTGIGGTKISTVDPYTVLESSIYRSLANAFDRALAPYKVSKATPVVPFKHCYRDIRKLGMSLSGFSVPDITLELENKKNLRWELLGFNLMKVVSKDVACLAFVDGGSDMASSIVIGGHQMENNLVEFDLGSSRMSFTKLPVLLSGVECSNFKF